MKALENNWYDCKYWLQLLTATATVLILMESASEFHLFSISYNFMLRSHSVYVGLMIKINI